MPRPLEPLCYTQHSHSGVERNLKLFRNSSFSQFRVDCKCEICQKTRPTCKPDDRVGLSKILSSQLVNEQAVSNQSNSQHDKYRKPSWWQNWTYTCLVVKVSAVKYQLHFMFTGHNVSSGENVQQKLKRIELVSLHSATLRRRGTLGTHLRLSSLVCTTCMNNRVEGQLRNAYRNNAFKICARKKEESTLLSDFLLNLTWPQ